MADDGEKVDRSEAVSSADAEDAEKVDQHAQVGPTQAEGGEKVEQNEPVTPATTVTEAAGSDRPAETKTTQEEEAFSFFTIGQKRAIVVMASLCAFFSPTTGSIYFPALDVIAHDLNVSNSKVNLTVTTYLILQGVAPTFVGGFSDGAGRRPAYILCFIVYIAANIGLGAQNSYAALITLRCLQAAGSSGTVALAGGVVADIVTASERGSYIAWASIGTLLGPIIGPILGGLLSQFLGWHWIFWFLAILAGAIFAPMLLIFPETNRKVVGDGSYPPPPLSKSLASAMIAQRVKRRGIILDPAKQDELRRNYKIRFPNPFATLLMAADFGGAIVLLSNGLVVATMYVVMTGITSLFGAAYGFNQIQISLCFIPFGAGSLLSSIITGRVLDWNFKRHATRLGVTITRNRRQDLAGFPIERARLEIAFPMLLCGMLCTIAYGWVLNYQTNLAGPLVLLFFIGAITAGAYQATNLLMIDNYPDRAATATAANNLFRCLLGAGATAILGPMLNAWGPGWTYTFAALLWLAFSPALLLLQRRGPTWRAARLAKEAGKAEAKRQRKAAAAAPASKEATAA